MSGTDIFVSYARQDRTTARMFADALTHEGFSVWWDASLRSGETFDEVIERNLREAAAVVVLWSPRSVTSRWVRAEATLADRRNKLVPAIIEPCDRPIIFELTHAAELSDWTGDATDMRWQDFVSDLRGLVENRADGADSGQERKAEIVPSRSDSGRRPLRPGNDEVIFANRAREAVTSKLRDEEPVAARSTADDVHCLEIQDEGLGDEPIVVDESHLKIGRSAPADIVLSHKSISREHCLIGLANDELLVTDLNSTNGTFIDGERITRATILPVGSILQLGEVLLKHSIQPGSDSKRDLGTGRLAAAS